MDLSPRTHANRPLDLEMIGQRVVALAELSVSEHLRAIARSQADGLLDRVRRADANEIPSRGRQWR